MPASWARVLSDNSLAPSSFGSARVSWSEPLLRVSIMPLVKSCRFCTTERLAPKVADCERSVSVAVFRLDSVVSMFALVSRASELSFRPLGARREVLALDVELALAGLVERHLEIVAGHEIDAVVARILASWSICSMIPSRSFARSRALRDPD